MRDWQKGRRTRRRQWDPCWWLALSFLPSLHFLDAFFFGYGRTGRGEAPAGAGVDAVQGRRCGFSGCSKSPKQGSTVSSLASFLLPVGLRSPPFSRGAKRTSQIKIRNAPTFQGPPNSQTAIGRRARLQARRGTYFST
ncbi:uncharacterized protein LY79DRAFT_562959 [Colletotrichum navitas]|uniref:Uncharacterized protein n=1 Tax=Colletotrichum navitas TaxID=681940 RepID=A0AAD8PSK6_9PEZI|nr:uncharacterized protein LY79DRAFT_562959 [Colletotrichum navitas]KAK1579964.1 hypothetical protein LY79DRAFT_562959 [Colletotrichum navitas]